MDQQVQYALLILGSAGAGKSTLINELSGKTDATAVCVKILEDGTDKVQTIGHSGDPKLVFIDTPGLDSKNFSVSIKDKIQKEYNHLRFLLVLVISLTTTRVTQYIDKFISNRDDLVGNKPFVICWTGDFDEDRCRSKIDEMKSAYPSSICKLPGEDWNEVFNNRARFSVLQMRSKVTSGSIAVTTSRSKPPLLVGLPKKLPALLRDTRDTNAGALSDSSVKPLITAVLKFKKDGGRAYQNMKMMGDALLKCTVLQMISSNDASCEDLETRMLKITTHTDVLHPMPRFYKQHIRRHHDVLFPGEDLSPHGMADVVEALLEYARQTGNCKALAFIMNQLMAC